MFNALIVDDHRVIREAFSLLLRNITHVIDVTEVDSGEEAIRYLRSYASTKRLIVFMDIQLGGISGIEATKRMKRISPNVKIIALSSMVKSSIPAKMIDAGADGFVTKASHSGAIRSAVESVLRDNIFISDDISDAQVFSKNVDDPFYSLSEREFQIALMIVRCVKVGEIAERLFLSRKTINTYRYRIFDKLGINGDVELTHLAVKHKLLEENVIT